MAIRNERLRRGLTVKELAARIGITPAALNHIESGSRKPAITTLRDLADAFGIPVADLFDEVPAGETATAGATADEGAA